MTVAYTPHLATQTPMQAIAKHSDGYLYFTQADPTVYPETTTISRVNSSGTLVDSMSLTRAGHGFFLSVEDRSGVPWIWTTWKGADVGGYTDDVVRFPYLTGTWTRDRLKDHGLVVALASTGGPQAGVSFNGLESTALLQQTNNDYAQFVRCDKSDLLAGSLTLIGRTITVPIYPPTVQGATSFGDSLYLLTGAASTGQSVNSADPPLLHEYSWTSGDRVQIYDLSEFGKESGSYVGGYMELEGAAMESSGGTPRILIGVTLSAAGSRSWRVYGEDAATVNKIVSYHWDLGDGTTSTAAKPNHTYATAGTYTVKLTVTDRQGQTSIATKKVTV